MLLDHRFALFTKCDPALALTLTKVWLRWTLLGITRKKS